MVPPLAFGFIEEAECLTARSIVNETMIEEVCTGLLSRITGHEDDKIAFVTSVITRICSSLTHFSGEELLALILGCVFLFKNEEKNENPSMALVGLLCSLAPDFFKLAPGPFFTSLYGTLDWCQELAEAEHEGASTTQLIEIITIHLKTTILQRSREGRCAVVENGESIASTVSNERRLFHDWYRLCYWLTRCIPLDSQHQVSTYIIEWGLVSNYSLIDRCKIISALGVPALFLVQNGARDFKEWCTRKEQTLTALTDSLSSFSAPFFSPRSILSIAEKRIQELQRTMLPFHLLLEEMSAMCINELKGKVKIEQFYKLLWRQGFSCQMLGSPRSSGTTLLGEAVVLLKKIDGILAGEDNEDKFYSQCITHFIDELKWVYEVALELPHDGSRSARIRARNNVLRMVGILYQQISSAEVKYSCFIKIQGITDKTLSALEEEIRISKEGESIFIKDKNTIYYDLRVSPEFVKIGNAFS